MINNNKIFVIIPAYNEAETVGDIVGELKQLNLDLEVIVVDDGSGDKTAENAQKAGAKVLRHKINLGQWAALRTGFAYSIINDAKLVVTLDADGQHLPNDIYNLVSPIYKGKADVVIGSRFIGDKIPLMHTHRFYGIKLFNFFINIRTDFMVTDCTSGYKAYCGELIKNLFNNTSENQYGALEALINYHRLGAKLNEVPINFIISNKTSKGKLRYAYNLLRTIFS